ncbi:hypothetical protein D4764_01G0002640 [Takifugu flavidus]|uniref:Uncharacterized protein n=1 Tax=Takifugu flavidus TaxID=433684 RepID=A0A5C6PNC2_9TELE|nr:hypothetical protein D4764_01G0002640 [Takifugu flavidus]
MRAAGGWGGTAAPTSIIRVPSSSSHTGDVGLSTSRCQRGLRLFSCLHPLQLSPSTLSTVTLNTRNGASEAAKEEDCKTPRLVESKIPEGDLLLQVSVTSV